LQARLKSSGSKLVSLLKLIRFKLLEKVMSLVKTLGRVAFGLIVAQASKKLIGGRGGA